MFQEPITRQDSPSADITLHALQDELASMKMRDAEGTLFLKGLKQRICDLERLSKVGYL